LQGVALRDQAREFLLLLREPIRRPAFIAGTRIGCGLLDQVVDVLAAQRNALVKLGKRGAGHLLFSRLDRVLKRDDFSSNRHPALGYCLSMIFSENRYPLFGIML
jgi:hypothetical protein